MTSELRGMALGPQAIDQPAEAAEAQLVITIRAHFPAESEPGGMRLAGATRVAWQSFQSSACAGGHIDHLSACTLIRRRDSPGHTPYFRRPNDKLPAICWTTPVSAYGKSSP